VLRAGFAKMVNPPDPAFGVRLCLPSGNCRAFWHDSHLAERRVAIPFRGNRAQKLRLTGTVLSRADERWESRKKLVLARAGVQRRARLRSFHIACRVRVHHAPAEFPRLVQRIEVTGAKVP